jgi:hypothetical protein
VAKFERYIGIDYSGAETPVSSLKGLRVYSADRVTLPREIPPTPASARKYWTRRGLAEWLRTELSGSQPVLVGIDHGFSFPIAYFEQHGLTPDWDGFLEDFRQHWPTDDETTYVEFLREGNPRTGKSRWLRRTEQWTASAKSVFQFDVQGSVAKSTHAGLPWLQYLRQGCAERVHFWPFDGWESLPGQSLVAEVYPSLWTRRFPNDQARDGDQQAAYAVAAWLRKADLDDALARYLHPPLEPAEMELARAEGWILGVT